ncbi:hypothetical protein O181_117416 [Austropuccinia psidii MF-1]|uniref:Uncharacterized protein n=1 Tax=Austropuccinia psidii MF-1 TaxID=1389203 RepID=A0A9Q3PXX3_9BASI|nr:hypothetical protein [Austropuccinia psidii MF-1]
MKDGNCERTFELGLIVTRSCHPWDSNVKNKTHQIPRNKTLPFLVCLARKPHGNQLQAQVAPNSRRTCSANPPNTMSHLFNPLNLKSHHMRTFQLVSLNLRWLRHNPWRKLLVSPNFNIFLLLQTFPHPSFNHLQLVLLLPTPSISLMICLLAPPSTPTRVPSQEIPTASSSLAQSSPHSHDEAWQELTDLRPTLMIAHAINQILLENRQFLHLIPFVDVAH